MIKDDLAGADTIGQLLEEITRLELQNERLLAENQKLRKEAIHYRNFNLHLQGLIDNFSESTWKPTEVQNGS